jgi:hypothetical protein
MKQQKNPSVTVDEGYQLRSGMKGACPVRIGRKREARVAVSAQFDFA